MKKTFTILLVSALAVWGYVIVQVVLMISGKTDAMASSGGMGSVPAAAYFRPHPPLDTTFRDPFQSYLYAQKPAPPVVRVSAPIKVIEPPTVVVNGILWGDAPMAILKLGDKTEMVKVGSVAWDLTVLRIDRNQVVVSKQGRKFTLEY